MPNSIATPNLLTDPGFLFWAPLLTAEPTNTVAGGVFTDAWPAPWIPLGATKEGSTFSFETKVDPINVAELFDPVKYVPTEQNGSIAFAMTDWTLANVKRALNGGALTTTGSAATTLTKFEPPDPADITRCMIGWESLDATVRLICRQTISADAVESAFHKGTDNAVLPVKFQFERPAAAKSFVIYGAGTTRGGS